MNKKRVSFWKGYPLLLLYLLRYYFFAKVSGIILPSSLAVEQ